MSKCQREELNLSFLELLPYHTQPNLFIILSATSQNTRELKDVLQFSFSPQKCLRLRGKITVEP